MFNILPIQKRLREERELSNNGQIGKTTASITIWPFIPEAELVYIKGSEAKQKDKAIILKFMAACWVTSKTCILV